MVRTWGFQKVRASVKVRVCVSFFVRHYEIAYIWQNMFHIVSDFYP